MAELLTDEIIIEKLNEDGIMEEPDAPWLLEWRQQAESWKFWQNRPSKQGKNIVRWDIDREA